MSAPVVCSVIVPSYRSAATIGACLHALSAQRFDSPYEIIVVDSSPDDTPAIVTRDFPDVRLIHLAQQTDPASARNTGAEAAHGRLLCFIDSDCVAAPDWLARLRATLDAGYSAVGGAIANGNAETLVSWAGYCCEFREFLPGGPAHDVDNLTLGNAAYKRDDFVAAGRFPVGYFPQEDQVFHRELRRRGMRIRLDPAIVVFHTHRSERQSFLAHQTHIGYANARVLQTLDAPGSALARRRWLAQLALPALVPLRFVRTLYACRRVAGKIALRRPALVWLCWLGMWRWGAGFVEGTCPAGNKQPV